MTTTDLWFAYYLRSKGHRIESYDKIQRGKCSFNFDISEVNYRKEKLLYMESEVIKIKSGIEELKELAW